MDEQKPSYGLPLPPLATPTPMPTATATPRPINTPLPPRNPPFDPQRAQFPAAFCTHSPSTPGRVTHETPFMLCAAAKDNLLAAFRFAPAKAGPDAIASDMAATLAASVFAIVIGSFPDEIELELPDI